MNHADQAQVEEREFQNDGSGDCTGEAAFILLASEGRPISPAAVAMSAKLAIQSDARVRVLSVARIWGSAFGLPHPGLMPTARELQSQRDIVFAAINALERLEIVATGEVLRSRNAAKSIAAKGRQKSCLGIVITADPEPHWLARGFLWSHEPYRVCRLSRVPVHLVVG